MAEENKTIQICYLCGTRIEYNELSYDHVPPKAFYPKAIRDGLNLLVVPVHKTCNESYKADEEYFQHALFIEVLNKTPPITRHLMNDFLRRAQQPQTPALIRKILRGVSSITPGGIHLPNGILNVQIDRARIERVALKISRGLFHIENDSFLPLQNAKDIWICSSENEVPDWYRLYWPYVEIKGIYPEVFSYKYFKHKAFHLYSMLFWKSVMFCVTFECP